MKSTSKNDGMDRIDKLKDFLKANPEDSFVQHALALEHIKLGHEAEAMRLFEALLSRDPGYVGSYLHLGKLFEKVGDTGAATSWYEKGMVQAELAGDRHAFSELKSAYEELTM
jgi:Tfp pilus assembly protein PilF